MTITTLDHLSVLYPASTPGALLAYVKEPFTRLLGYASGLPSFAKAIAHLDTEHDVYLTVNSLDGRSIQARSPFARGAESEVISVVAFVADVDAEKLGHSYPPQSFILDALAEMPLPPSIIAISGRSDGGVHAYWLMDSPVVIRDDAHRTKVKSVSRRWQTLLKSELVPYDLDATYDLVRVLRPIGTTNKKYGAVVSALSFAPDRRYTLEDFERHLPEPPAPPPIPSTYCGTVDRDNIVDRARAYVGKIPGAINRQGGHDATFHVACVLILDFNLSVDQAYPIIAEWNQTCRPPWSEGELRHKLDSANKRNDQRGRLLQDAGTRFDVSLSAGAPFATRLVLSPMGAWI